MKNLIVFGINCCTLSSDKIVLMDIVSSKLQNKPPNSDLRLDSKGEDELFN